MSKMNADRLRDHQQMIARAQAVLDSLNGKDIQIEALRERLGIGDDSYQRQVLKGALDAMKGRTAERGHCIGWWRSSVPQQQPLPVGPAVHDLTGLKPQTVDALRERLAHARAKHKNEGFTALRWLTVLMGEATEAMDALCGGGDEPNEDGVKEWEGRIRDELLDVATVALRAHEEWAS